MNIQLREITFSDNSKAKYLILNHPDGRIGRMKVQVKQWNYLKKMGVNADAVTIDRTKHVLENS